LLFKVCHFLKKQTLHWTQHMATFHSNTWHNFAFNNKQPHRFYSTTTQMMSSVLTAVVVVGKVWQVTAQHFNGRTPSAYQYESLPMVVGKCPTEQILWDTFLASEAFVFYIQFLQNSIQYTTNNFPDKTW